MLRALLPRALPALLCAAAFAGCARHPAGPVNLVVLVADDLGWADVGFHGAEILTPNLDRLAREGLELERFYTFPLCSPTRAAFLTGRSPIRYGLGYSVVRPWTSSGLPPEERLLSEVLKAAGYSTAAVGKWHLGNTTPEQHPGRRGFDHFYGCLNGAVDYFSHRRDGGIDWQRDGRTVRERGYATRLLGREAARLVRQHDPEKPLFLYVPFTAPHIPLQAPDAYLRRYADVHDDARRVFAAMVNSLDDAVGEILDALDERGMRENTLVLFFSDNGALPEAGGRNTPLRDGKATIWEGGVRTPALLRWPGVLPAGMRSQQWLSAADLFPTLLAALALAAPEGVELDGRDLWTALRTGRAGYFDELVLAVEEPKRFGFAAYQGPWKLVMEYPKNGQPPRRALYHLEDDPGEERDLAGREPDRVALLAAAIARWHALRPPDSLRYANRPPEDWTAPEDWAVRHP